MENLCVVYNNIEINGHRKIEREFHVIHCDGLVLQMHLNSYSQQRGEIYTVMRQIKEGLYF